MNFLQKLFCNPPPTFPANDPAHAVIQPYSGSITTLQTTVTTPTASISPTLSSKPTNVGFRSYELKIKVTSLAAEIKLIRENERRLKRMAREAKSPEYAEQFRKSFWSLREHCEEICEPIAREAQLAYGFLRGIPYSRMEKKRYSDPRWDRVEASILKWSREDERITKQRLEQWKQEAGEPTPMAEKWERREKAKAVKKVAS